MLSEKEMIRQLVIRTEACLKEGAKMLGLTNPPRVYVSFMETQKSARIAGIAFGDNRIEYNKEILELNGFDFVTKTLVPHEVAHILLCHLWRIKRISRKVHHGAEWKRLCIALGGDGKTHHTYKVPCSASGKRQTLYQIRCPHCGNTFFAKKRSLSTWVRNDFDYTTKCCKSPLHEMQWREIGLCQNTMEAEALAKSSRKRWKPMSALAEHLGIVVWTAGAPLRATKTFKF